MRFGNRMRGPPLGMCAEPIGRYAPTMLDGLSPGFWGDKLRCETNDKSGISPPAEALSAHRPGPLRRPANDTPVRACRSC